MLEAAAGMTATAAVAALAGCLSDGRADGTSSPDDSSTATRTATEADTTTPADGAFAVGDWLPAPATVEGGDHQPFAVLRPEALAPHTDALGRDYYDELVTGPVTDLTGVDPEHVRTHVAIESASVVDGSFDGDAVTTSLEEDGFERSGTHEGFDVWTGEERSVAVGDDRLVVGRGGDGATAAVEATVDAGVGATERYRSASDAAAELLARLDDGHIRFGVTQDPPEETDAEHGTFAGNTGLGYRAAVGDDTSVLLVFTFPSADDADPDAVQEWVDAAGPGGALSDMRDVSVEADGTVVTVSGTIDTGDVPQSGLGNFFVSRGSQPQSNVQAGASVQVDDTADTLEVYWTSNQNADHLTVTVQPADGSPVEERIDEVGGSVGYDGDDGETVTVSVVAHAGDRSTVVLERTVEL